eukprot:482365_1
MYHKQKIYIVGDRVLVNKQQGTIKYIGELISSNEIWIGVELGSRKKNMRQKLLENKSSDQEKQIKQKQTSSANSNNELTNGSINNITYIRNKTKKNNIIFIKTAQISKCLRGVDNKHLSRNFFINQQVWVKSIKCKGIIKSMFYEAPKYILDQMSLKKGKQYLGILLKQPLGNNCSNKVKYFQCEDNYDYFLKIDSYKDKQYPYHHTSYSYYSYYS